MRVHVLALSYILAISINLHGTDVASVELDEVECGEGLTIDEAIALLEKAKIENITWKEGLQSALGCFIPGGILTILGGVGVGFSCPDVPAYEAASIICGFSATGLFLGILGLAGGAAVPGGIYIYNNYWIKPHNESLEALGAT